MAAIYAKGRLPSPKSPYVTPMPRLVVFSGLPCTGKTTLCRDLAEHTRALYLPIDNIEEALKHSTLAIAPAQDAGYRAPKP